MNKTIDEYRELVRKLNGLLADPQPGLSSWSSMFGETMSRLVELWSGPDTKLERKVEVRFTREGPWPIELSDDTPEEKIETLQVPLSKTYVKRGKRFYKMILGHGLDLVLPVSE